MDEKKVRQFWRTKTRVTAIQNELQEGGTTPEHRSELVSELNTIAEALAASDLFPDCEVVEVALNALWLAGTDWDSRDIPAAKLGEYQESHYHMAQEVEKANPSPKEWLAGMRAFVEAAHTEIARQYRDFSPETTMAYLAGTEHLVPTDLIAGLVSAAGTVTYEPMSSLAVSIKMDPQTAAIRARLVTEVSYWGKSSLSAAVVIAAALEPDVVSAIRVRYSRDTATLERLAYAIERADIRNWDEAHDDGYAREKFLKTLIADLTSDLTAVRELIRAVPELDARVDEYARRFAGWTDDQVREWVAENQDALRMFVVDGVVIHDLIMELLPTEGEKE